MIDDLMEWRALERIADDREGATEDVSQVWLSIRQDIRQRGPFAALLAQFRLEATTALSGLATTDPIDTKEIARLQNEVQRFISTMEIVQQFKSAAEADEANFEADHGLDDDDEYTPTIED